jgi:hypothetical protein
MGKIVYFSYYFSAEIILRFSETVLKTKEKSAGGMAVGEWETAARNIHVCGKNRKTVMTIFFA